MISIKTIIASKITKNFVILSTSDLLNKGLGFIFTILVARFLGPDDYGVLTFGLSFVFLFQALIDMGICNIEVREVARDKTRANLYLSNAVFLKIVLGIALLVIIAVCAQFLRFTLTIKAVVFLMAVHLVAFHLSEAFSSICQAFQSMQYVAASRVILRVVMIAGAVLCYFLAWNVVDFAVLYPLSSAVGLAYLYVVVQRKYLQGKVAVRSDLWRSIVTSGFPIAIASLFTSVSYYINPVMLKFLKGTDTVGVYSAAHQLTLALLLIPSSFDITLFPIMSELFKRSLKDLESLYKKLFEYSLILAIPIGLVVYLLAKDIIVIFYGPSYVEAIRVLQVTIWLFSLILINRFPFLLFSTNLQRIVVYQTAISASATVALNFLLIPKYGAVGAGLSATIAQLIAFVYTFVPFVRRGHRFDFAGYLITLFHVSIAAAVMILAYILLRKFHILAILAGLALYFLVMYLMRFKLSSPQNLHWNR